LGEIPHLRAFAVSLARNPDRADDLIQQTMLRAYSNIQLFDPGSNLSAWLITILRNEFYSEQRRRRREIPDSDGAYAGTLVFQAAQVSQAACREFYEALGTVPEEMRKPLLLIGAYGFSYGEVARACACAVGTVKSRVHRARAQLAATLSLKGSGHFAADAISQSVAIQAEHGRSHRGT
jgi:RNA polymerase sigma-70 factor (ECF subfamily)